MDGRSSAQEIARAGRLLAEGGVVAFPTETVYGLGASVRRLEAVRRIFEVKGRPGTRALIVHVAGPRAIDVWSVRAPAWVAPLVEVLWPGPLTVVLERHPDLDSLIAGGGDSIGLRAPAHAVALQLLENLEREEGAVAGIAAPSANRFGHTPPTSAREVRDSLGDRIDGVLDGGRCALGIESTVIDARAERPRILRAGAISRGKLESLTGRKFASSAPSTAVNLNEAAAAGDPSAGGGVGTVRTYAFGQLGSLLSRLVVEGGCYAILSRAPRPEKLRRHWRWLELGPSDAEFARDLYPALKGLESAPLDAIYIERPDPSGELAEAIEARLDRLCST